MSIIEKLEKISAQMFKEMLKTYQFKDVVVHKRASHLNPLEYCSFYPNKGVGFKIRRKTWPKGMYYLLKEAHYKVFLGLKQSNRFGHFVGQKFNEEGPMEPHPRRLQALNKRGVWEYDLGDFESFTTDNGLTYTRADYEAYFKLRAPKTTPNGEEVVENIEGEQAQGEGQETPENEEKTQ